MVVVKARRAAFLTEKYEEIGWDDAVLGHETANYTMIREREETSVTDVTSVGKVHGRGVSYSPTAHAMVSLKL